MRFIGLGYLPALRDEVLHKRNEIIKVAREGLDTPLFVMQVMREGGERMFPEINSMMWKRIGSQERNPCLSG